MLAKNMIPRVAILFLIATISTAVLRASTADSLMRAGVMCMQQERFVEALDYLIEGMEQAERDGDRHTYISCLGNIGSVYGVIGNWDRSLECQKRVCESAEAEGNDAVKAQIILNMFGSYIGKGDLQNAKRMFREQVSHPVSDTAMARHYFLYNQGEIANLEGNIPMAEYYFRQVADIARSHGDTARLVSQLIRLGELALQRADRVKARSYADSALNLSRNIGIASKISSSYSLLENICRREGDTVGADHYKKLGMAINDSIFGLEQMNMVNNRFSDYEKKVDNRQISSLNRRVRGQLQTIILCVALLIVVAVGASLVFYNYYRLRQTQKFLLRRNEELEQADERNELLLTRCLAAVDESEAMQKSKEEVSVHSDEPSTRVKTAQPAMSALQTDRILSDILRVMDDIPTISRHDFSLAVLAKEIGSNTKYVATVIKMTYGKTFKEFLNSYRIREACRRLGDKDTYGNLTIEAIYRDLGYNSASGFIEAFKRVNGMTPSTYQKLVLEK